MEQEEEQEEKKAKEEGQEEEEDYDVNWEYAPAQVSSRRRSIMLS